MSRRVPLSVQVVVGAVGGALMGMVFGKDPFFFSLGNDDLGKLGMLVIRLLKALAAPLILFAIVDAFVRTHFGWRQGLRLVSICAFNALVACSLGLALMNVFRPGIQWQGKLEQMLTQAPTHQVKPVSAQVSLDPIDNLASYVPESFVEPFRTNNMISIVLAGVLFGLALRHMNSKQPEDHGVQSLVAITHACLRMLVLLLEWVVRLAPFAVFGATADAVGRNGLASLSQLFPFVGILLLGMSIHALLYYPLMAWLVGGKSPKEFLAGSSDAAVTGLSCNSSLATVPVTLKCLTEKLKISESSARLSACVGTNLNNDGITIYEAMTAVFLAQALGQDLTLTAQVGIVFSSIMAGVAVAGVPEAGLIVLPLVLGASGLPNHVVEGAIPLILPVDWIIARARTGVNVMSDIVVAVMLEPGNRQQPEP